MVVPIDTLATRFNKIATQDCHKVAALESCFVAVQEHRPLRTLSGHDKMSASCRLSFGVDHEIARDRHRVALG